MNHEDRVIFALSHINDHYSELTELEPVAEIAHLSSRQLTKSIKHLTGMSYNQYLHYIRASKALSRLLYSEVRLRLGITIATISRPNLSRCSTSLQEMQGLGRKEQRYARYHCVELDCR